MSHSTSSKFVNHTYRDFSRFIEEGGQLIRHKKCHKNFPAKVHQMLSDSENSHIVTWMPHGRAFKVLDKDLFVQLVIPNYIICKKYESFTRQLNGWGFKRLYQMGPDHGCYYHECFLMGKSSLTTMIKRLPSNQGKTTPYPTGEPNFYRISERYPLHPFSENHPSSSASAKSSAASQSTELSRDQKSAAHESSANSDAKSFIGTSSDLSIRELNASTIALSAEPPYLHPSSSTFPSLHAYSSGFGAAAYRPFPPQDWSYQRHDVYSGYSRSNPPAHPDISRNYRGIPYFQSHHHPHPSNQPRGSYVPAPPHPQHYPIAVGGHSVRFVQSSEYLNSGNQTTSTAAHLMPQPSTTCPSGQFEQDSRGVDPFGEGNNSNQKDPLRLAER